MHTRLAKRSTGLSDGRFFALTFGLCLFVVPPSMLFAAIAFNSFASIGS